MVKVMWCWRCQMEIPMLERDEYEKLFADAGERESGRDGRAHGERLCVAFSALTGFEETNVNAIFHHVADIYGPPCESCGKPLRTPVASFCAACGHGMRD